MKGYLIYNRAEALRNKFFISQLIGECTARGASLELLIEEELEMHLDTCFAVFRKGIALPIPDFVIARSQNYTLSRHFELMGVRVFNSSRVCLTCNDKMLTYQLACSLSLPVQETVLCPADSTPVCPLPFPCVIKPRDGKGGLDVLLAECSADYERIRERFAGRVMLCQALADKGRDTRFYVMGGEVVCAFTRISDSDFRSNFCLGGRAIPHTPTPEELHIVESLCAALSPDYVGIDIIYRDGSPVFNEIEDAVGARMVYANTDINMAGLFIERVISDL